MSSLKSEAKLLKDPCPDPNCVSDDAISTWLEAAIADAMMTDKRRCVQCGNRIPTVCSVCAVLGDDDARPAPPTEAASRISKPWAEHLAERLRTNEERAGYLSAALEAVENYSPKDELAGLCLVVQDVIKSLRVPVPPAEASALIAEAREPHTHYSQSENKDIDCPERNGCVRRRFADALERSEQERDTLARACAVLISWHRANGPLNQSLYPVADWSAIQSALTLIEKGAANP